MNRILRIDPVERLAVVQPGVVNDDLRAACAEQGLWYPPDPASSPWSTIGGNTATNAGGMCCVKYGVTRDYVLGLEVVNGLGETVRVGRRDREGGRRIRPVRPVRRLRGHPRGDHRDHREAARRPARRAHGGGILRLRRRGRSDAVSRVTAAGIVPSALELLDRHCLKAVDEWKNMGLSSDADAILLGRVDTPGAAGDAEAEAIRACFAEAGAAWAEVSTDQAEADALFQAQPARLPGAGAAGTGAHRGRRRAAVPGAADAGARRGDRGRARRPHRQHRPHAATATSTP